MSSKKIVSDLRDNDSGFVNANAIFRTGPIKGLIAELAPLHLDKTRAHCVFVRCEPSGELIGTYTPRQERDFSQYKSSSDTYLPITLPERKEWENV